MALHAHARAIFPENLVGRGPTGQSSVAIGAVFLLQWLSGVIVQSFADAADPAQAYRVVFGFLAAVTLAGLLIYLRIDDARPSMADAASNIIAMCSSRQGALNLRLAQHELEVSRALDCSCDTYALTTARAKGFRSES
jgi:hypothetical protein